MKDVKENSVERISYSVVEAAAKIGISSRTLWSLIRQGQIGTFRIGTRVLIPADVLRAFIAERTSMVNGNP